MLWSYGRERLAQLLTPAEMATVRGSGLFCSTSFTFSRRGKPASAMVVDGWRGARVYIGDDIAP